jgi:NADPH:quinone reductase-like Zn-dependent oxidoreductase
MNAIRITLTGGLEVLESDYVRAREDLTATMGAIFERYIAKELEVLIKPAYALEDAAEANRYLESHKSTGKLLLSVGG